MNTQLQFLSDTFQFETEATVTGSGDDDDGPYVVTNQTVFYPGGGGQEPDKGLVTNEEGMIFPILKAKLRKDELRHYLPEKLPVDSVVKIAIDRDYRLQNTRLHTAGHLLASVVFERLDWPLRPVKGFHYQKGAYVEFEPEEEVEDLPETALEFVMRDEIVSNRQVMAETAAVSALQRPDVLVPDGFVLHEGQSLRLITIEGYKAVPCRGTHLHHTGEIGSFSVKQIRHKKGRIRISYRAGEERD